MMMKKNVIIILIAYSATLFGQDVSESLAVDIATQYYERDRQRFLRSLFRTRFRRGGKSQTIGRQTKGSGQTVDGARQMVALVEHDQPEFVADGIHPQHGRIVGADRDVADVAASTAQHPDLLSERPFQLGRPLMKQVDGGDHDQCGPLHRLHGHKGEKRFPGSGRHNHHAAPFRLIPRTQRRQLMGHGRVRGMQRQGKRLVVPGPVVDGDPRRCQHTDDGAVGTGFRTMASHTLVEKQKLPDRRQFAFVPADQQRARIEEDGAPAHWESISFRAPAAPVKERTEESISKVEAHMTRHWRP